ncbi:protein abrupt-like [Vanessa tameamea]|uniref:Protein abrupt-like n=1 Tax=Vanessa tameamea TaxID=334116 RepID=A0A8B8ICS5_VANTA|nr:protein abrupt-like isoform X1 [Vanessa tameamea]
MEQSQFALSWDEHVQNICNGLSLLQQNGEFVDMTLAADGHHVKVHQVIMALSSPFLKDLISTAQCPHPVIFLSKISHTTLSALLEYMYTGEVLVAIEDLNELIDAAKELHIKGLQEMNLSQALTSDQQKSPEVFSTQIESLEAEEDICYFEISNQNDELNKIDLERNSCSLIENDVQVMDNNIDDLYEIDVTDEKDNVTTEMVPNYTNIDSLPGNQDPTNLSTLQYTVSNQGSLQMILNRFIYYLKHTNRDMSRQWRCVEYLNNCKCPAYVFTKDDVVVQRISAHNHPFHDQKILKKVKAGAIFTAINDAENEGTIMKNRLEEQHETE